jgi:hypothetical protein
VKEFQASVKHVQLLLGEILLHGLEDIIRELINEVQRDGKYKGIREGNSCVEAWPSHFVYIWLLSGFPAFDRVIQLRFISVIG